jgi:hypothetical protein
VEALPSDEQVRVNGPGCVACDLFNDFDHARTVALGNAPDLSEAQQALLEAEDSDRAGGCFECEPGRIRGNSRRG